VSFRDFRFPDVCSQLSLSARQADLYSHIPAVEVSGDTSTRLADGVRLAATIQTEKAISEYLIAPMLAEAWRMTGRVRSIYSGVELNADASAGLNGVCDFLIGGTEQQFFLEAPLLAVAESKPGNTRDGLGQCIAAMVAVRIFNERAGKPRPAVHGASTCGTAWRFLRLEGDALTIDIPEYYIDSPGRILGVLTHLMAAA
jgi:hypothetical protein